ncbi:hypothetical protein [Nocardia abscessus]|uniref:hypothetical protein n=1 Tax=Nocardia abscessus TaxID=120957 RepID=UPI002457F4D3|nr:hypothetical protein [Nocardia abscessus]
MNTTPSNSASSYEPTAASRTAARGLRDMHLALVKEGFTEGQALQILGAAVSASIQASQ